MQTNLRLLTIVPEPGLREGLEAAIQGVPMLHVVRSLPAIPDLESLLRSVRVQKPDSLILSVARFSDVEGLLQALDTQVPWLPIIAVTEKLDDKLTHSLMRAGVRDCIVAPFTAQKLSEAASLLARQVKKHPAPARHRSEMCCFLPAKPGVGTTTIALSVSCALADEFSVPTLLLDCDLAAGIVSFHLKLDATASLPYALQHAENLDEDSWRQMVAKRGKLEVLHAGGLVAPAPVNPSSVQQVLALARAQYDVICADLPSSLDEFSIEMMRESQRIILITTPEVAAVHLAKIRVAALRDLGLADRTILAVNRKDHLRGHLETSVVERAVGLPVSVSIGNDYATSSKALIDGSPIPSSSAIGKAVLSLAQSLLPGSQGAAPAHGSGHKFLEFFHIRKIDDPTAVWRD